MENNKIFHAFISYSHKDRSYASVIQKSIETLGLPIYRNWQPDVKVFRDERKIPLTGSLTNEIISGLENSQHLIVIASKNSANSNWVKEEIVNWHRLNKDKDGYIINFNFILIDNVIEWDYDNHDFNKLKTTALPSFEKKLFKTLPLWANIQSYCKDSKVQTGNSNYEWEIAKIKAMLLHKKPDDIIDEVSKGKRLFRIISGAVISILVLLSVFAYYQRSEALSQKKEAILQKDTAIAKTKEALDNLKKFKLEEFERNFKNGNTYFDAEEYSFADTCFSKSFETAADTVFGSSIPRGKIKYLTSMINICKAKSANK